MNTDNIPLPYNAYAAISGVNGLVEEQYFSCKPGFDLYEMYGNKVNHQYFGNFGVECNSGETTGKWRVLGLELTPQQLHSAWHGEPITSIDVYKILEPTSGLFVVSFVSFCMSGGTTSCHQLGNINPKCTADSATCKVEHTVAPVGQKLFYWYFKTTLTNAADPKTPGVMLELKASHQPWPNAPKVNVGVAVVSLRSVE